jgi:acyl-CoA thioesterase FadM
LLDVATEIGELGGAAFWVENEVRRNGELLAEARVRIACTGAGGGPRRIPVEIAGALMKDCGGKGP